MSKKRLRLTVILLSVCFFFLTMSVNFFSTYQYTETAFFDRARSTFLDSLQWLRDLDLSQKKIDELEESNISIPEYLTFYCQRNVYQRYFSYPFIFAVLDNDKYSTLALSQSSVFIIHDLDESAVKDGILIHLEEYMTEELRKELDKYHSSYNSPSVKYFSFKEETGKYIPVELCFNKTDIYDEKSFFFSDEEPTVTFTSGKVHIRLELHGFNENFYESGYTADLEKALDNMHGLNTAYTANSATLAETVYVGEEAYTLYFSANFNPVMRTLFSRFFVILNLLTAFLFLVAGTLIFLISRHFQKKSQALESSKRTFISAAAHELKTPLAVIQNQCECIMEDVVPEKKDEYIKSVYDEALRMNDIVSSLLTFNRLSSTDKIEKERCNLSELLKKETSKYLSFAEAKNAEITVTAEDDIYVSCNAELMALAIDNYLSNAVKYTTGEKKITVSLTESKNGFYLEVFNTAEPIDEKEIKALWNVLERQDIARTRKESSTGMGLPICKRIFDIHGFMGEYRRADNGVIFSIKGKG